MNPNLPQFPADNILREPLAMTTRELRDELVRIYGQDLVTIDAMNRREMAALLEQLRLEHGIHVLPETPPAAIPAAIPGTPPAWPLVPRAFPIIPPQRDPNVIPNPNEMELDELRDELSIEYNQDITQLVWMERAQLIALLEEFRRNRNVAFRAIPPPDWEDFEYDFNFEIINELINDYAQNRETLERMTRNQLIRFLRKLRREREERARMQRIAMRRERREQRERARNTHTGQPRTDGEEQPPHGGKRKSKKQRSNLRGSRKHSK
jgi:hypothetical protein